MVVRFGLLVMLAIGFPALAAAEDTPAPTPTSGKEAEKELAELKRAREILEELKGLHEAGEISEAEFGRRSAKIRVLYLGEGELPDGACAAVTCSFRGSCEIDDGEPVCECDDGYLRDPDGGADCVAIRECEPGYTSERSDGSDCEVDIGWAREAAITGVAAASLLSVTGGLAALARANLRGGAFIFVDLGLLAVAGPVVGAGANSARKHPGVDGNPLALGFGIGLYSLSMVAGVLDYVMIDEGSVLRPASPWITATWTTIGAASLLLFSLDALTSHEQAVAARDDAPPAVEDGNPRIWTWIAFGNAGASAIAAVVFGAIAAKSRVEIDDACPDDLWNDADEPCPGGDGGAYETHKFATGMSVLMIDIAVVSAAVGVTLYFLEPRLGAASAVENVSVVPWAVPGGAGLALGGEF